MAPRYPSIPDPTVDPQSLRDSVLALKQAFELLAGLRGDVGAASAADLASASATIASQADDISSLQDVINALSYVGSIEGLTGAFTLNETSGIENSGQAIQLRQASASQFGAAKVDDATLQAVSGVLSTKNPVLSKVTGALSGDVSLNNTGQYFTGPSVTLGTGIWFVMGTVCLTDSLAGVVQINCKLWDGTTVISSAATKNQVANFVSAVTLSGVITNPGANVEISCNDQSATTGKILYNQSGNSKDSHITAFRIG